MAAEISDDELRRRLTSHGYVVGPITESTRTVLMRKLDSLSANDSRLLSKSTKPESKRGLSGPVTMPPVVSQKASMFSFSSDESDTDDANGSLQDEVGHVNHSSLSSVSSNSLSSRLGAESNLCSDKSWRFDTSVLARPSIHLYANGGTDSKSGTLRKTSVNIRKDSVDSVRRRQLLNNSRQSMGQNQSTKLISMQAKDSVLKKIFNLHHSWQLVSGVLIVLVFVFALVVTASYIYIARGRRHPSSNYLMCGKDVDTGRGVDCTHPKEVQVLEQLIDPLLQIVTSRAGEFDCGYHPDSRQISKFELKKFIQNWQETIESESDMTLDDCLKKVYCMILENPSWGIDMFDKDGLPVTSCNTNVEFVESKVAKKSLWCRVMLSARIVFFTIFVIAAVIGAGVAVVLLIHQRQKWAEAEQQEVFSLVEKVVDMLKQNADAIQSAKQQSSDTSVLPYLAIAHVRDALIPLHHRQAKQAVWDKAVRFLSANESRVRVENQKISGEDFEVWRWIQPTSVNGPKVWQGQAFGENSSSSSRPRHRSSIPTVPLTTCLKIRNMFDVSLESGDKWHKPVEDAVLDKSAGAEIIHIAVDASSTDGCVYVRCRDLESARITFKALHGWWFDGRLVTVKYLREQRYEERYPVSRNANVSLKPSTPERLSLSRPFHSSIIENS